MIDIRHRLGHFAEEYANTKAHEITTRDLQTWINRLGRGPTTKKNARTHFSGLFNFALKRQYIKFNPASALTVPKQRTDRRPGILTAPEVRTSMNTTLEERPQLIPYVTLCIFAGIRPTEATRIDWKDITLDRGEVFVSSQVSKRPETKDT